jgi:hypothetical protein
MGQDDFRLDSKVHPAKLPHPFPPCQKENFFEQFLFHLLKLLAEAKKFAFERRGG